MDEWLHQQKPVLVALVVFVGLCIILGGIKKLIWSFLDRLTKRTVGHLDDEFLEALNGPAKAATVVLAILGTAWFTAREEPNLFNTLSLITKFSLIALGFWVLERILTVLVNTDRTPVKLELSSKALLNTILRTFTFGIGLLVILDTAGIKITPVLASLGIGSLAVALALQDTLGNFFSSVYLLADKPIRLGDFIQTEDGSQGTVRKIGWRSTRIITPGNQMLIFPNSKLASSRLINFEFPDLESAVGITWAASPDADLNKIEQVSLEVAREIQSRVPGAIRDYVPLLRFHTLNEYAIMFDIIMRAQHFGDGGLLKHEFIKTFQARLKAEGIPIPRRVIEPKA